MNEDTVVSQPPEAELPEKIKFTRERLDGLQQELTTLRDSRRPALAKQIQRAILFMDPAVGGDVANVARYDLGILDQQIAHIESMLGRAQVLEPSPDDTTVQPGSRVTVRYEDGTEETLTLVGRFEADPSRGYVSSESPVGKALVGKPPDSLVAVGSGDDSMSFTVVGVGQALEGTSISQ